jgi:hypothetical protein
LRIKHAWEANPAGAIDADRVSVSRERATTGCAARRGKCAMLNYAPTRVNPAWYADEASDERCCTRIGVAIVRRDDPMSRRSKIAGCCCSAVTQRKYLSKQIDHGLCRGLRPGFRASGRSASATWKSHEPAGHSGAKRSAEFGCFGGLRSARASGREPNAIPRWRTS